MIAWLTFAIYFYCTATDSYFKNHNSLYFSIGSKAIIVSAITAGISSILSTYYLIKNGKNMHNYISIGVSYPISAFFILMFLLAIITGGA